jgi:hypothetical protein
MGWCGAADGAGPARPGWLHRGRLQAQILAVHATDGAPTADRGRRTLGCIAGPSVGVHWSAEATPPPLRAARAEEAGTQHGRSRDCCQRRHLRCRPGCAAVLIYSCQLQRRQVRLERLNAQLRDFYGPLYAIRVMTSPAAQQPKVMSHNDQGTRVLVLVRMRTTMLSGHRSGYQQPRIPMAAVGDVTTHQPRPSRSRKAPGHRSHSPVMAPAVLTHLGPPGLQTSDSAS